MNPVVRIDVVPTPPIVEVAGRDVLNPSLFERYAPRQFCCPTIAIPNRYAHVQEAILEQDSPEMIQRLMTCNVEAINKLLQMALLRNKPRLVSAIPDIFKAKMGVSIPYSPVFTHLFKEAIEQKNTHRVKLLCELNQRMGWGILERECDVLVWDLIQDREMLQILEGYYPPLSQRLCNAFIDAAGEGDRDTLRALTLKLRSVLTTEPWVCSPVGTALERAVLHGRELIIRDLFSISSEGIEKPTLEEVERALHIAVNKKSLFLIHLLLDRSKRQGIVLPAEVRLRLGNAARVQGSYEFVSTLLDQQGVGFLRPIEETSSKPCELYRMLRFEIEHGNMRDAAVLISRMQSQHCIALALEAMLESDSPEGIRLLTPYSSKLNLSLDDLLPVALLRNKEKIVRALPDLFQSRKEFSHRLFINLLNEAMFQNNREHVTLLCELNNKMDWKFVE